MTPEKENFPKQAIKSLKSRVNSAFLKLISLQAGRTKFAFTFLKKDILWWETKYMGKLIKE